MGIATLSVSEAKTTFSDVIDRVDSMGESFVIKKRGRPVARIIPLVSEQNHSAAGSLSKYAAKGALEDGAFAEAMVKKHASHR